MKTLGIRSRLLASVFMLIAATTFALGYMGIRVAREFVQSRFENRIFFLARHLAVNSELGILLGDTAMLKRLAGNLLLEKDVMGAAIFDGEGRELARAYRNAEREYKMVEAPVVLKEEQDESRAFREEPESNEAGRVLGKVSVSYDTTGIDEVLNNMKIRFVLLSSAIAAIAGLVFYFLSRSLMSPVSELALVAKMVARGDESVRASVGSLPETRELAKAFNTMLDTLRQNRIELEEANREIIRKSTLAEVGKFSMMVAHEVKNPLSIIKTSFDMLKGNAGLSSEDTMVYYIEDEIRRLNKLIEDFLAFARPSNPVFREVDLNAMLKDLLERFEFSSIKGATKVTNNIPAEPCIADADPDLLKRAIDNILKNAVEAGPRDGKVAVSASCGNGRWIAVIEDEGEGIREEDIARLFEPFFTTRSKGTGLGLAYALQVLKAHRGSITAGNRPSAGAVFRVEVPLQPGEQASAAAPPYERGVI